MIYLSLSHVLLDKSFTSVGPETISLSKVTQVITNNELQSLWSNVPGSTILFHINPTIKDRTAQSGNEYADVIKIGSKLTFRILVAPDAGRGLVMAPAQLKIITGPRLTPTTETVDIPNFPLQRWTAVAIVKDGRRFNVYLNGTIAVSYTCIAMPQYDITQPLIVGDLRLGGTISLMSISPNPLQPNEIRDLFSSSVDTSGEPYKPLKLSVAFSNLLPDLSPLYNIFEQSWCPGGNCSSPVAAGPMQQWTVPYA